MNTVQKIESFLPSGMIRIYRHLKELYIIKSSLHRSNRNLKSIAGKFECYNVIFFLEQASLWKYHYLYDLMEQSKSFNPTIVICPNILKSRMDMLAAMHSTYEEMKRKDYNVILGYDEVNDSYINVPALNPHIIFFTSPWEGYMHSTFHIKNYSHLLTCYMNYGWATTPHKWSFVTSVSLRSWRYFQECQDYNLLLKQWVSGENALVTGYPMYDDFLHAKVTAKDWKIKNTSIKRVIYAPHHSIPEVADGILALSTFLIHYNTMLEIVDLYRDKIQFAFKPHPLLKRHLYLHPEWGKERTDEYYKRWEDGDNTCLVNGEYVDLFKSSDALIHDCSSFTMEYLFTKKPVMFLSNKGHDGQANVVALRAYEAHYKGLNKQDICAFLDNVVLKGEDPNREKRESFYCDVLLPPNGCTASENILNEIKQALKLK